MGTLLPPSTEADRFGPLPFSATFEIVVIPVADVDRAKDFYARLGWRFDIDYQDEHGFRVIQYTPPGSGCSVMFGSRMTTAEPGSAQGLHLVVSDIARAHDELARRGIDVSEVFHDAYGVFHRPAGENRVSGPAEGRKSYGSFLSFRDPDGNEWVIQEVTERLPGRV
ncbi:Predicted lactoylglutathione lyase [Luteibacter sp. UNCMF331Sha3.1]|uniref:VOC family protein n=1 Tax=Luteibacter sp. UNCMF331Sha3.1 TaxID=1502760 RepID=UPI0008D18BFD|nr:VOC family protein [Luteibacter sp. UNCMF331Sha3.1]SEN35588.1 Predicted lactoylglutathione lyase [Luteibacter sp. UNCMF331Sha3.1]